MSLEYVTPELAYKEAEQRLGNDNLQERVADYLGGIWPEGFDDVECPRAVFAPYLAKGSKIEIEFLRKASEADFRTTVATYEETEYVTANSAVVDCYRAPFIEPRGQRSREWVVSADQRAGKLGDAETVYTGLNIVDYWTGVRTALLKANQLPVDDTVVDFSSWYRVQTTRFGWQDGERSKSPYYYKALMGLYASGRAVLFDTPPTEFADRVMAPAASMARSILGYTPLVTCELRPEKRDWTDISLLSPEEVTSLKTTGRVQ